MGRKSLTGGVSPRARVESSSTSSSTGFDTDPCSRAVPARRIFAAHVSSFKRSGHGSRTARSCLRKSFRTSVTWSKSVTRVLRSTCNDVFDEFMKHCASRMSKNDLAFATLTAIARSSMQSGGRRSAAWISTAIKYSVLVKIADARTVSKKTYNNIRALCGARSSTVTATIRKSTTPPPG